MKINKYFLMINAVILVLIYFSKFLAVMFGATMWVLFVFLVGMSFFLKTFREDFLEFVKDSGPLTWKEKLVSALWWSIFFGVVVSWSFWLALPIMFFAMASYYAVYEEYRKE